MPTSFLENQGQKQGIFQPGSPRQSELVSAGFLFPLLVEFVLVTGRLMQHMDSACSELTFCPRQGIVVAVVVFFCFFFLLIRYVYVSVCVYMMCKCVCMNVNRYYDV